MLPSLLMSWSDGRQAKPVAPVPQPDANITDWGEHEIHAYHFAHLFEFSVEVINTGAGLLILFSLVLGVINLVIVAYNAATEKELMMINPLHSGHNRVATVVAIRLMLGELTALALAVLVAADVVDTVIKPTHAYEMNVVIKMGFITVLRTGLAYFLAKEIKEQEEVHNNIVRSRSVMGLERFASMSASGGGGGGGGGLSGSSSGKASPSGRLSPVISASSLYPLDGPLAKKRE